MLGKLIKYEYRATARYFLPLYIALVIVAGLAALVGAVSTEPSALWFLAVAIYTMLALALAVVAFVATISRFYKNLLGAEGYLMFTLPVSTDSNILAKLIVAVSWILGSALLGALTILIFSASDLIQGEITIWSELGSSLGSALYALLLFVLATAISVLFCYLCMAIGQLFNEHKFLASVGTFLVLQTLLQIIGVMGVFGLVALGKSSGWLLNLSFDPPVWAVNLGLVAILLAVAAIEYLITRWLLDKKLNLA